MSRLILCFVVAASVGAVSACDNTPETSQNATGSHDTASSGDTTPSTERQCEAVVCVARNTSPCPSIGECDEVLASNARIEVYQHSSERQAQESYLRAKNGRS